ncbi:MAG TPA: hypothetical protein VEF06_08220, partial [Bryobacteraceae bacterium]|nr:hypothetical protein [Bryobacteraceae bacterium]
GGNSAAASATDFTLITGAGTTAQTITFGALSNVSFSANPLPLNATASSGLTVIFYSTTTATCTVSGSFLTLVSAGTCSVTAIQPGNSIYSAAPAVTDSFTITQGSQTITFPTIATQTAGTPPFSITATASSGLAVIFTSQTPSVCTVSGATVTLVTSGNCTITASQAGNADYSAAPPAGQTFVVNPGSGGGGGGGGGGLGQLSASPPSLAFSYKQGAAIPAPQTLSITSNRASAAFTAAVQTASGGNWLSVSATGQASTPGSLSVSVSPAGLTPGTRNATITVSSASASLVIVPVILTVSATFPATPVLSVSPAAQRFALNASSALASGSVTVSNIGGGTLSYQAAASSGLGNWLSLTSGASGSVAAGASAALGFTVNPAHLTGGTYAGSITVTNTASNAQQQVSVTLAVSQTGASLAVSETALSFNTFSGGAQPPSESFTVSNSGAGSLAWTASTQTLSGGTWLGVSPASGTSIGGQPGVPVSVTANPAGLAPGQYYGSVNIAASGGGAQTVTVLLNVVTARPGQTAISLSSGGAALIGTAADTSTAQRQITLFNPSTASVTLTATVSPANSWLSVSPSFTALPPGSSTITVTANFATLSPGFQTGTVTLTFSDFTTATIQVVAIATAAPSSTAFLREPRAASSGCTNGIPSSLVSVFDQPIAGATLTAGIPATIQVELFDDCGNSVSSAAGASAQVSFSSADPAITLTDTGSGIWQATWNPAATGSQVALRLTASESALKLNPAIASSITVAVQASSTDAAARPTGIVNAAAGAQATPQIAAPASYIAIYGSNLTSSATASASTVPFPTTLAGTQVFIGGEAAPLAYAGPGQINAIVPQNLTPGAPYPLLIVSGTTQSVPTALTVAAYQPGIYTVNASGSGQAIAEIAGSANLATPATPAHRGSDYLEVFCTGLGPVSGPNGEAPPADGAAAPGTILYSTTANVSATLGGVNAPVVFAGLTPTLVSLYQVNIQVPATAPAGNAVPLVITVTDANGNTINSNSTTVALQ